MLKNNTGIFDEGNNVTAQVDKKKIQNKNNKYFFRFRIN